MTGGILTGNLTMRADINFQNGGGLSMGGGSIINVGTLAVNDSISIASGNSTDFMKSDGSSDNKSYVQVGTQNAGSVPYFTSTNTLSGASRNLFVQLGVSTIQSGIDAITLGGATGGSVQVSSGGSTENVICVKQNYTLVGAICPPFTQTTQITGSLTIGSAGFLSTRVSVSYEIRR